MKSKAYDQARFMQRSRHGQQKGLVMTTLSFESIKYSPRKAAVRRAVRPAPRLAVEQQPVSAAIRQLRAAGARNKGGLAALIGLTALAHVGVIVALHRPATALPEQPRVQPLAIEIAPPPPPPPPPPEPPKPQPRIVKAAPVKAAPPLPVVSPQAVDNGPPTADTVQVATAPAPAPAPVVAAPPPPPPEPVTEARGFVGYRNNPAPDYPALAQDRGMQGRVILKVHVLASGKADNVTVDKSTGFKILDDAAIKAVLQWTFDPARRGQTPIDGWVTVPLNFKLS
jgi:protein TonB